MVLVDSWVSFNFAFYQNVTSINIESVTKQSLKYLYCHIIEYGNLTLYMYAYMYLSLEKILKCLPPVTSMTAGPL